MDSGQYDQEYLDYLRALLEGMSKHGLVAYVVSDYKKMEARVRCLLVVYTPRCLVAVFRRCKLTLFPIACH
jgi:hypothetical protein